MIAAVVALWLATATDPAIDRAIALTNEYRLEEADALAREALCVATDDLGRARALDILGIVERSRGHAGAALDYTSEALALAESVDDPDLLARVWNDLGRIELDLLLDNDRARGSFRRGLALQPRVRDRVILVRLLNNLGNAANADSDYGEAVRWYSRSLELARKVRDRQGILAAEHNIGLVQAQQNEPSRALEHFQRALKLEQSIGSAGAARTLLSISEVHRALGRPAEALRDLQRARAVARKAGDELTIATILLREGDLHTEAGRFTEAERAFTESRRIVDRRGDPATVPRLLAYRAKLRLRQKRWRDAVTLANDAASRAAALEQLDTVLHAQLHAGDAYVRLGDTVSAKRAYLAAIDAVERKRTRVAGDRESRQRAFEGEVLPYLSMMEITAREGDAQRALEFAERAKARVLLDVLRERGGARGALALSAKEAIVEYALTDARGYAFVVTAEGTRVVPINVTRADMLRRASSFASELAQRNLAFRRRARELYDLLIAPLPLAAVERLCIIPDQSLWQVPLHALIDPNEHYLIERMAVFYAPSIAALRAMSRSTPARNATLLAAGNIPEADAELRGLRALYAQTAVETRATEEAVKRDASRYDVLHFAAHGLFDDTAPLDSHLAFVKSKSEDGRLTARELMRLRLNASLVVLSACETGAGRPAAGEGLIGMSWALFVAGCPVMVASEWDVESESTTRLMLDFHRGVRDGLTPAEALRHAQLALMKAPKYEHPFYWAAFVVLGRG